MLKYPFTSEGAPIVVPLRKTLQNITGSPLDLSYTKPLIVPFWEKTEMQISNIVRVKRSFLIF